MATATAKEEATRRRWGVSGEEPWRSHSSRKRGTVPRSLNRVHRPGNGVGVEAGYERFDCGDAFQDGGFTSLRAECADAQLEEVVAALRRFPGQRIRIG
jgi:hypothetical protein